MNLDTTKSIADITQESVHTSDDIDIGDIEATSKDTVVVKRGIINVHYYYIPVSLIEGSDEQAVWLTITEQEIKDKYEKDSNQILPNTLLKIRDIAILIGKISLLYHQFQKKVKKDKRIR
jgi:hypothetical protein